MKISILKQEAKFSIKEHKGIVFGTTLLFTLISIMFTLCLTQLSNAEGTLTTPGIAVYIIMLLVLLPLSCGITNTIVKISSNQKVSATEFINYSVKNFIKIWKILFRMVLEALLISVIAFVVILVILLLMITVVKTDETAVQIASTILTIIYTIVLVLKLLPYSFSFFIFSEHPERTAKEITTESKKLMKGNLLSFIILIFSFIGWYLLLTVINEVAYFLVALDKIPYFIYFLSSYLQTIFLTPYIIATQYAFYEELLADNGTITKVEKAKEVKK